MSNKHKILNMKQMKRSSKNELMEPWKEALLWGGVICLIGWAAFIMLT